MQCLVDFFSFLDSPFSLVPPMVLLVPWVVFLVGMALRGISAFSGDEECVNNDHHHLLPAIDILMTHASCREWEPLVRNANVQLWPHGHWHDDQGNLRTLLAATRWMRNHHHHRLSPLLFPYHQRGLQQHDISDKESTCCDGRTGPTKPKILMILCATDSIKNNCATGLHAPLQVRYSAVPRFGCPGS
jgi:hypothetical protein